MNIKIFGSGCAKCKQLTANTEEAAQALGVSYELTKITDMNDIIDAGVMKTPALGLDDEIVVEGKIPTVEELKTLLS